jgi:hypothetical protein
MRKTLKKSTGVCQRLTASQIRIRKTKNAPRNEKIAVRSRF